MPGLGERGPARADPPDSFPPSRLIQPSPGLSFWPLERGSVRADGVVLVGGHASMKRTRIVLAIAATLGACLPLQAQTGGSSNASPGGEEILFQELPSVFGASKYEQKPSEAPASVSIITADEIEKYGYRTLA